MTELIVELVKQRRGFRGNARNEYIETIVKGVIAELETEQGVLIDIDNPAHLLFIVDYASDRYANRDSKDGMPRHLQFRLHNLFLGAKK